MPASSANDAHTHEPSQFRGVAAIGTFKRLTGQTGQLQQQAHAGLFDDDEARARINEIRKEFNGRVDKLEASAWPSSNWPTRSTS